VTDPHLQQLLGRTYNKRRHGGSDTNLQGERLKVLWEIVDPATWRTQCEAAADAAKTIVLARPDIVAACEVAVEAARRNFNLRLGRLRLRAALHPDAESDLVWESQLVEPFIDGLRRPSVRIDSVGLYVLSGNDRFANSQS